MQEWLFQKARKKMQNNHKVSKTRRNNIIFKPITEKEELIAKKIVDAAYQVHKKLGPGLLEKIYSPRWIVPFYEMCYINGFIAIFEKMFQLILNCIQQGKVCFCYELSKNNLKNRRQVNIPILYDGITFDEGLRIDVFVEELIICEIKSVEKMNPVWEAQILSYLKLTGKRLGFIINFNAPLIKNGIKRIIL